MKVFAFMEGFIGLLILTGPRVLSIIACFLGIALQASVIQMMYMLRDPRNKMVASCVTIAFLVINLIILLTSKEEEDEQRLKKE